MKKKIVSILVMTLLISTVLSVTGNVNVEENDVETGAHPSQMLSRNMWDLQFSFDVEDESGYPGNYGAEFGDEHFYSTRWASNLIHEYTDDGKLSKEFSLPTVTGLRDLAYDGNYFYGGSVSNVIYEMDFDGETLIDDITIQDPSIEVRSIAYDVAEDAFWVCNYNGDISLIRRDGSTADTIPNPTIQVSGSAYDDVSPGGPFLWVFSDHSDYYCYINQYHIPSKTLTAEEHCVELDFGSSIDTGQSGGLFFTTDFKPGTCTLGGLMQGRTFADDTMFCYEVCTSGSSWSIETVDSTDVVGMFTSIALDAGNYPHISHYDYTNYDLKYAYKDAGGWHNETVDITGNVGVWTSIALDTNGYPHISYYNNSQGSLKYAYKDAGGWHTTTVDNSGSVGTYTSIALDAGNYPHISYHDNTNLDLKYAYKDAGGWHTTMVDSTGRMYTSIALDTNGYPHMGYYAIPNWDLKYAYKDAGGWHKEPPVDGPGDVGLWTSIALDTNGYPHISYFDNQRHALKYAYKDAGGWHTTTVDNSGSVGYYTSISLDACNYPHISHYDQTNYDLKYAYKDTTGWHKETVDSTGGVGMFTSIALDTNGDPHISYYDGTNGDLKYAYNVSINTIPDLDCDGSLSWVDVKPSSTVTGSFTVLNVGEPYSFLNWKIDTYPGWMQPISPATTPFNPDSGNCLTPEDGAITVDVEFEAPPDKNKDFTGVIKIVNLDNPNDYCEIDIFLSTPRNRAMNMPFLNFLQQHPILYQLLQRFLRL